MNKEQAKKLQQLQRAIAQLDGEFAARFGLNLNEAVALCHLLDCGEKTSGEVAASLSLSNPSASKVLASVEKKGLVTRKLGATDHRQWIFELTPQGQETMAALRDNCDIAVPPILEPLLNLDGDAQV